MIKLNVLAEPDRSVAKKRAIFVISCVLALLGASATVAVWLSLTYRVAQLQSEVQVVQRSIDSMRSKNRESVEIEATVTRLSKLAEEISAIKLNQVGVAQLMIDLSRKIPEKVWLTSLEKKDQNISLQGYAIADFDLASFQRALETLPYVKTVELERSITVYLNKMFAFDSVSNEILMQIIDTKNTDKFSSFIQARAQARNMKIINGPPPAGSLQRDPAETSKTSLGWTKIEKAAQPGFYVWSKSEVMEAKQFDLNLILDFSKIAHDDSSVASSGSTENMDKTNSEVS